MFISRTNWLLRLHKEGIQRAEEALGIYEGLDHTTGQTHSLQVLAWSLYNDKQLDAAEEAGSKAVHLLSDKGNRFLVCGCYRVLGNIYRSRGKTEEAIDYFKTALEIAIAFNWQHHLFWTCFSLAELFFSNNRFDCAHAYVERVKSHATNSPHRLGHAKRLQARFWYERRMLKANSEALGAIEVYEKIGAAKDVERCRSLLRKIERASRKLDFNGELLEVALLPTPANFPFSAQVLVTIPQIHLDALYHESSAPHRNGTDIPLPAVGLPIVSATSFLPPSKKPSPRTS